MRNRDAIRFNFARLLSAALLLLTLSPTFAAGRYPAQVLVWQETLPDKVIYHYTVVNKATQSGPGPRDQAIQSFWLGYDRNIPNYRGQPQLKSEPTVIQSPPGWSGKVEYTEATRQVEIHWVANTIEDMLKPGQSLPGFRVELPVPDATYATQGIYSLNFGDISDTSGPLTPDPAHPAVAATDTLPPTLAVQLTPNVLTPVNDQYVTIVATITVADNVTLNPVVKLESVTCNEPTVGPLNAQGVRPLDIAAAYTGRDTRKFALKARRESATTPRVYTVTYSATDAAGNKATASATVTVP